MDSFTTRLDIKLDWSEMDLFGHINNVAYFKYVQAARVHYLELIGVNTMDPENKNSFAVAASTCQFKQPLYFPGSIVVQTRTEWIKNTSLQLNHTVLTDKNEVAAEAQDVIVLFDYAELKKMLIPDSVRSRILKNEG
jgi:acyl-CoA thioester hydrolase